MARVIEISGLPFEMGRQLGVKAKRLIRDGTAFYRRHWKSLTEVSWARSVSGLRATMPLTKKWLPKTFDELRGMAEGSGVPLNDLFVVNSFEAVARFEKCTTVLARTARGMILAHNEDWVPEDEKWVFVVHARPAGEPAFFAMAYGAWIPNYGVNDAGLAFAADSHVTTRGRFGLSQTLLSREVLRFARPRDAARFLTRAPRADGHTYALASAREGFMLETTAAHTATLRLGRRRFLAHTNFFQTPAFERLEKEPRTFSHFRWSRVSEVLDGAKTLTIGRLERALADHHNFPDSVCNHSPILPNPMRKTRTIASITLDPGRGAFHIRHGYPCTAKTQTFHL